MNNNMVLNLQTRNTKDNKPMIEKMKSLSHISLICYGKVGKHKVHNIPWPIMPDPVFGLH